MKHIRKSIFLVLSISVFGFLIWRGANFQVNEISSLSDRELNERNNVAISWQDSKNSNNHSPGLNELKLNKEKTITSNLSEVPSKQPASKAPSVATYTGSVSDHSNSPPASRSSAFAAGVGAVDISNQTSPKSVQSSVIYAPASSTAPIREVNIAVPIGAKVPVLFQDNELKPPQQMRLLDQIANEFQQNISEIPPGMTQDDVWEAARLIADERYLTLFGYQAFNEYHLKAALEALKEKKGQSFKKN
jgi:hypothetical protein